MPVFNGERHLAAALESILSQTFSDIEVIISDNASTDATEEIARDFASRDQRIRYLRNPTNIGGPANFNRLIPIASRRYFKWAAYDDLIAPGYLKGCVDVLDAEPQVILASSRIAIINQEGRVIKPLDQDLAAPDAPRPSDRLRGLLLTRHGNFHLWGVMRTDALAAAGGHHPYPGGDRSLIVRLSLRGRFHLAPERMLMIRDHPERTVRQLRSVYRRIGWHDPKQTRRILPHWWLARMYLKAVRSAPIDRSERRACYFVLARWLGWNWTWARLITDLLVRIHPGTIGLYERLVQRATKRRRSASRRAARQEHRST